MEIIESIAAKWKTVGIHMDFDPTGHTINLIGARHPLDPEACCTEMMQKWLGGRGRQPANWATLVRVLRDAEFSVLAGELEQVVPTLVEGGRGRERRDGEKRAAEGVDRRARASRFCCSSQ